ncbi:MAG: H-NS histone family protein [Phaeospirillum sp.]|nr:H-NS histone family protein [Phaeospirillum sp.]
MTGKNPSLADLLKQQEELAEKIKQAKAEELESCRADALSLIESRGFTVAEILGTPATTRGRKPKAPDDARAQVAPKFRNPDNPSETWTGRGRQPKWIAAKIAGGVTMESLKIA